MKKHRVYICFDYDHDNDIKGSLVGQARLEDSPFDIVDMSIKEAVNENWKKYARQRIKSCDQVIVLCGKYTNTATGVSAELTITQEENIPYFLLCGRSDGQVKVPKNTKSSDKLYRWTWDNLKSLIRGNR
jgi:hypothetical protein